MFKESVKKTDLQFLLLLCPYPLSPSPPLALRVKESLCVCMFLCTDVAAHACLCGGQRKTSFGFWPFPFRLVWGRVSHQCAQAAGPQALDESPLCLSLSSVHRLAGPQALDESPLCLSLSRFTGTSDPVLLCLTFTWVLGIKLSLSGLAASTLTHWANTDDLSSTHSIQSGGSSDLYMCAVASLYTHRLSSAKTVNILL